jgi:hypothetical protein
VMPPRLRLMFATLGFLKRGLRDLTAVYSNERPGLGNSAEVGVVTRRMYGCWGLDISHGSILSSVLDQYKQSIKVINQRPKARLLLRRFSSCKCMAPFQPSAFLRSLLAPIEQHPPDLSRDYLVRFQGTWPGPASRGHR